MTVTETANFLPFFRHERAPESAVHMAFTSKDHIGPPPLQVRGITGSKFGPVMSAECYVAASRHYPKRQVYKPLHNHVYCFSVLPGACLLEIPDLRMAEQRGGGRSLDL